MSALPREIPETRQQPSLAEPRCCHANAAHGKVLSQEDTTQGKYALERGSTFLSSFAIVLFPPGGAPARRDMAPRVWAHTPGKA
jgi:hypothetical protein